MAAVATPILIKRLRDDAPPDPKSISALSARIALCAIFVLASVAAIQFASRLAIRWPHGVSVSKTLAPPTSYPTAAAWLSFRLHFYNAAASYLSDEIRAHPGSARAYDLRALAYWETSQLTLARRDFRLALELDPNDQTASSNLAALLRASSDSSSRDRRGAVSRRGRELGRLRHQRRFPQSRQSSTGRSRPARGSHRPTSRV